MVGILISELPSMYLFSFTLFWHPAGKNPVPTARELSETIGTSERNTDSERMIKLTFFSLIRFLLACSWQGHTRVDIHTPQVIQGKKKLKKRNTERIWNTIHSEKSQQIHYILFKFFCFPSLSNWVYSTAEKIRKVE